jgi:hypothetical protein
MSQKNISLIMNLHTEDKFKHVDRFFILTMVFVLCLIVEFVVVLLYFVEDPKISTKPEWKVDMKRAIFCLTLSNVTLAVGICRMEESKIWIQCFKETLVSKTIRSICWFLGLLIVIVLCSVGVSFWIWQV